MTSGENVDPGSDRQSPRPESLNGLRRVFQARKARKEAERMTETLKSTPRRLFLLRHGDFIEDHDYKDEARLSRAVETVRQSVAAIGECISPSDEEVEKRTVHIVHTDTSRTSRTAEIVRTGLGAEPDRFEVVNGIILQDHGLNREERLADYMTGFVGLDDVILYVGHSYTPHELGVRRPMFGADKVTHGEIFADWFEARIAPNDLYWPDGRIT